VLTLHCTLTVTPGTPGTWVSETVQHGTKEVENKTIAGQIKQLNQAADHLDTEAAEESAKSGALSAKASALFGEWETTREEADVAHGDAVQAAYDASEDWNTARQLAQVASADEQAAMQAEQDYLSLERAYKSEQNKAKGSKGKGKGKGKPRPKPPPAPRPPITGPPEGSGPPGTGAPGTSPGGGPTTTAPAPGPPDAGPPGPPKRPPPSQGSGATQGSEASSEPSPWAKSPPEQDPPRDQWIAGTGPPLEPVVGPNPVNSRGLGLVWRA
jgi:hypothetical protein